MQLDVNLFKRFGKSWNGPDHFAKVYGMVGLAMVTAIAIFKLQPWCSPSEAYVYKNIMKFSSTLCLWLIMALHIKRYISVQSLVKHGLEV